MKMPVFALALLAAPALTLAHEVKLEESAQTAAVLQLRYADGQPFAFEAYELYRPGRETPEQVGRTNASGQIIFLPGGQVEWRVKAFSADGHGIDQRLSLKTTEAGSSSSVADTPVARWSLLLAGLGIILGLFGFIQLFLRKKSP